MTGTVKRVYRSYAFIRSDAGVDHFVLWSDVEDFLTLVEGDRVVFEPMEPQPDRGPRALQVALLAGGDQ